MPSLWGILTVAVDFIRIPIEALRGPETGKVKNVSGQTLPDPEIFLATQWGIHISFHMTKPLLLALFAVIGAATLVSADAFEGQYDMNFKGPDMDIKTTFWVKGGNIKMRHHGQMEKMGDMIMREDMSTMIVAMPQMMAYLEMPIPSDGDFSTPAPSEEGELPFKKTGESKEILGHMAHQFIIETGKDKVEIWATDELGSMPFTRNKIFEAWAGTMRQVSGLPNFFPLETIVNSKGKEEFQMKVIRIEKMELPDSTFDPPTGYRKMVLPEGMGSFMG